jgi:hypothetical protein
VGDASRLSGLGMGTWLICLDYQRCHRATARGGAKPPSPPSSTWATPYSMQLQLSALPEHQPVVGVVRV